MLVLELNRENIEYDVYSLVKAFYPEEQVAVLMPESRQKNREELADKVNIRVELQEDQAKLWMEGRDYCWNAEAHGILRQNFTAVMYAR